MDADTRVEESFAGWLYRPYFDLATLRAVDDGTADRLHSYQRYEGGLGRDPVSATKTSA